MKTGQYKRSGFSLPYALLLLIAVLCGSLYSGESRADSAPLRIGVLAIRGMDQCLQSWAPTADYLSDHVAGQRFIIVPLAHDQIYTTVKNGGVDFILANSAFYVGLEHWYRANRIVTLKKRRASGVYTRYGGVIFCRRDQQDIRRLEDLIGRTFMAVSETSLGGWLMAWREFKEKGIDPYSDFDRLDFDETHDEVVYAVRDHRVDAGTVRTNTLEDLSAEGKINLNDFYVFPPLHAEDGSTAYFCTTREYPEWPMAKVKHTSDTLAEEVAVALLQMPPDSPAARAAGCAGWTIPLNYQPVHDCLKVLKVGPYKDLGKITVKDVFKTYGHWIIFACAAFCILTAFTAVIMKLNRRIRTSNVRLQVEMDLRRQKDRELKSAKELAEAATRAKSEFLANMSHEIRTPMNGVIAATDLALGEKVSPKIENYLKIIQTSAYSLLGIINDILDFSKIEAGKFELKPRTFRLSEVFDRVMELFYSKAADKGIELLVDCDPDTPKVLIGDPLRLQQILTNLISNAIKFTESGGVILVSVKPSAASMDGSAGDTVILSFSVKDTGTGIAPEYRDLLFEPFSQADTSSTRKYEGTGLGLSICKQLVTMMHGTIGVESELGRGSTFFFTVRLDRPADKSIPQPVVPPDIQGLTVLVVDDLSDSRLIMRKMLESLGFRVETLSSGTDALSRLKDNQLRNNPIELIMMDWKMPQMDGIEASRKIRQEMNLSMPIIMMTAFGKEEQRIQAQRVGINGFLIKPIYPSTLFDAIMDGFGKGRARDTNLKRHFTTRASIYRTPLKGLHMLVAEDNPTNQQVAQAILEGAGIVVTIVGNGDEAVEAVRNHSFDAVLMDIQMPKMNGYEATRQIRALPRGNTVPIVAMTAHAMKGDEEKCLEAGMDGYISKPVNQDRLFHTLWRLLRSTKGAFEDLLSADEAATAAMATENNIAEDLSAADESPDTSLPDTMPGINIKASLASLNIDGATLARIMTGFLADNRQTTHRLRQALSDDDLEPLRQLAHSLKGSAANIGANDLSQAAYALEDACRSAGTGEKGRSVLGPLIDDVVTDLDQVLASIQSLEAPVADEKGPTAPVTAHSLATSIGVLTDAIEKADPEAVEAILSDFKRQARQSDLVDPSILASLEAQIERYDYDQALDTIRKLDMHRS
jgi:two-component system, sensor histidine kinase and response regulator